MPARGSEREKPSRPKTGAERASPSPITTTAAIGKIQADREAGGIGPRDAREERDRQRHGGDEPVEAVEDLPRPSPQPGQEESYTVLTGWMSGKYERPGMMGWSAFKERITQGIDSIITGNGNGKNIIVFSSGGPISALMQIALGISDPVTAKLCWQINNASITRFVYNTGGITLAGFNNFSHLEMKKDSGLITYR